MPCTKRGTLLQLCQATMWPQTHILKSLRLPNKQSYFNEISKVKGVKKIAFSQDMIGDVNSTSSLNVKGSENKQLVNYLSAGAGYFKVMGIEIKEGRGFSDSILSDTLSNGVPGKPEQIIGGIVLNETAVKDLAIQKTSYRQRNILGH